MLNTTAIENVTDKYKNEYGEHAFHIEEVTESTFQKMIDDCDEKTYIEEIHELYDDEEDRSLNTWIDVEGEGYGWVCSNLPQEGWHEAIRDCMFRFIDHKKKQMGQQTEHVCIVRTGETVIYHFIERESELRDTVYTFSDKELEFMEI